MEYNKWIEKDKNWVNVKNPIELRVFYCIIEILYVYLSAKYISLLFCTYHIKA